MNTKSKIQLIKENIEIKENFKNSINGLIDKYNIVDNVFVSKSGKTFEALDGYFVVKNEYETFDEAMNDFTDGLAIRIENNKKFTTGTLYEKLSECPEGSKVLDINTEKYVY